MAKKLVVKHVLMKEMIDFLKGDKAGWFEYIKEDMHDAIKRYASKEGYELPDDVIYTQATLENGDVELRCIVHAYRTHEVRKRR